MTVELQRTYSDLKRSKTNVRAGSIPLIPSHTFCDVTTVRRYLKTSSVAYVLRYYTFQGPIWLSHLLSSVSSCTEIGFTDDQFTSMIIIKKKRSCWLWHFLFLYIVTKKEGFGVGISRFGFDHRPIVVGFVVNEVSLLQAIIRVLRFSVISSIPPMIHVHY